MASTLRKRRELASSVRRELVRLQIGIVVAIVVLLWAAVAARYFFGFDLMNRRGDRWSVAAYLWIATIGSASAVAWGYWAIRRRLYLAEYGIEVTGVVTRINVGSSGLRPVRYSYRSGPLTHAGAADMLRSEADALDVGSPLKLLVDPRHPRKSQPYDDVLPSRFAADVRTLDTPSAT